MDKKQSEICLLKSDNNENILKFLSVLPEKSSDRWKQCEEGILNKYWVYYYIKKSKYKFHITIRHANEEYDVFATYIDNYEKTGESPDICHSLINIFITDFKEWAKECGVVFEIKEREELQL